MIKSRTTKTNATAEKSDHSPPQLLLSLWLIVVSLDQPEALLFEGFMVVFGHHRHCFLFLFF
jgi:hypothetical protein